MNPLSIGTKFKKNELLASTKNFSNKENMYVSGRNVNIAVMNYLGYNYEDAYVISDRITETTTTDTLKEVSVIIPPDTKVFKLEKELNKQTNPGDVLVEFAYEEDISNYMLANDFEIDSDEVETILGSNNSSIFLNSPGGEIVDIKVYINDRLHSDRQLIDFHKELVNRIENIRNKLKEGKTTKFEELTSSDNIESKFFKKPKPLRVGENHQQIFL